MKPNSFAWETAPAKINLSLKITGRRADGYHLLNSLVAFTDFGDRVSIVNSVQSNRIPLEICGAEAENLQAFPSADNLCIRAAEALFQYRLNHQIIVSWPFGLKLEKNLPIASGIGGGSADAAATLRLLNRHYGFGYSSQELAELSLPLGADVPACIWSQSLIMSGIGDQIQPITLPPQIHILLVNPRIALPTAAVFAGFKAGYLPSQVTPPKADWNRFDLYDYLRQLGNDLTAAAIVIVPTVGEVLSALQSLAGAEFVAMSGSGASCFALFNSASACDSAAKILSRHQPDWWIHAGRLV